MAPLLIVGIVAGALAAYLLAMLGLGKYLKRTRERYEQRDRNRNGRR